MLVSAFFVFVFLFLLNSSNLLFSLIILEVLSFFVLSFFVVSYSSSSVSDFIVICVFSIFVMEGVIALSGMISSVTYTGSDSVSSSATTNF